MKLEENQTCHENFEIIVAEQIGIFCMFCFLTNKVENYDNDNNSKVSLKVEKNRKKPNQYFIQKLRGARIKTTCLALSRYIGGLKITCAVQKLHEVYIKCAKLYACISTAATFKFNVILSNGWPNKEEMKTIKELITSCVSAVIMYMM
ncbi:CLUMA_CG005207, isoform A [Clunio marinus]|uniref:CLUMA_CG005207, isoform A n=1 Tax=Clunio marinus TaxID=568069 RepID=A0A1J1HYE0_9DIPT|nr:CLUMA_CG005207, isoform A [Clunio marinus]